HVVRMEDRDAVVDDPSLECRIGGDPRAREPIAEDRVVAYAFEHLRPDAIGAPREAWSASEGGAQRWTEDDECYGGGHDDCAADGVDATALPRATRATDEQCDQEHRGGGEAAQICRRGCGPEHQVRRENQPEDVRGAPTSTLRDPHAESDDRE